MKISHGRSVTLAMEMVRAAMQHPTIAGYGRWLQSDIDIERRKGVAFIDQRHFSMKIDVYSPNEKKRNWIIRGLITVDGILSISQEWAKIKIAFDYYDNAFNKNNVVCAVFECEVVDNQIKISVIDNISYEIP